MSRLPMFLAAAATAALMAGGAQAATLGDPAGVRAAAADLQVTDQVHCRPGRWHHRARPHDGCYRGRRGAVVIEEPGYYAAPGYGYYGAPYGYYGGPSISFGFGFGGPRWGHRHW